MIKMRNNFIMALLKLGYSNKDGLVNERHINFYKRRAKHVGAVTLEPLYIDKGLRELPTQLGIDEDAKIESISKLVDVIHFEGAKVIAHLNHPGRLANPKIPGNYFVSASDKPCPSIGKIPKKMDKEDIEKAKNLFVEAAKRVEKAGFDMLELQFGHGHLVAQFMSSEVNDRDDEYGGSFENRIRFGLEVLKDVKQAVKIPIIIRLSGDEITPTGIKLEEIKRFAVELEKAGASALHVIAGNLCSTPPWFFQHMFVQKGKTWDLAKEIKKVVDIPVIFVGQINTFEDIERLINEYDAQYIAVGRALVADPDFIGKYLGEVEGVYRPCMACSDGCLGGVKSGKGLGCLANPKAGKEDMFEFVKEPKMKKIAIVGAGLSGMEAALNLSKKGYNVDIYEKDRLGGQFNLAYLPPKKQNLKKMIDYYERALNENNINIIRSEIMAEEILNKDYDEVIIATGSKPFIPPIEGLTKYNWAEILEKDIQNKKIVIIGGGLIGIEVAHYLLHKNNEVIIVEMLSEVARGMEGIEKALTLKSLKEAKVPIYVNSKVTKIEGNKVYVSGEEDFTIENVDEIVVATGMKSYHPLYDELKDKIPVHLIGDAEHVAKAQDAIKAGFEIAKQI